MRRWSALAGDGEMLGSAPAGDDAVPGLRRVQGQDLPILARVLDSDSRALGETRGDSDSGDLSKARTCRRGPSEYGVGMEVICYSKAKFTLFQR